jgi:hypothetical protein
MRARVTCSVFQALFVVALLGATLAYPGGSYLHPHAPGFSWREGFWCDLLREPAHDGSPNGRAVVLASAAFVALAAALLPFWLQVSRLLPSRRARWVQVAGVASSLATALVPLVPSDRFPGLHGPLVLTAGGLGFACGLWCGAFALARFRALPLFAASSAFLLACASANLVLYVWRVYLGGPETRALPGVQKLATFGLMVWMQAGLAASARRPKP